MAPKKAFSKCLKAKHFQGERHVRAGLIAADEVIQAGGTVSCASIVSVSAD